MRAKLSAVVVSYNRTRLIGTCLRGLGFADEVIVVDKSSTDGTGQLATRYADRVITVPWSPTVEATRAFAVAQCEHEWIICLDDDECLSPEAIQFIQTELDAPRADAYALLLRNYILGTHDEAAYYWPEHQVRLFRRGAVTFSSTVHGGAEVHSDSVFRVSADSGAAIHHLSHLDVAQWVEKTNRYTSHLDRERVSDDGRSLVRFARERVNHWLSLTRDASPGGYPEAVCVLRTTYDLIDRLKVWEEERGIDAAAAFERVCASLDVQYRALGFGRDRNGETWTAAPYSPRPVHEHEVLRRRLAHFRARHDALAVERDTRAAEAARLASDLGSLTERHHEVLRDAGAERRRAERAEEEQGHARLEAVAQRQRAEQAEALLASLRHEIGVLQDGHDALCREHEALRCEHHLLRHEHDSLRREHDSLRREHAVLQGSLRTFLRSYLPLLRKHTFGHRP